MNSPSGRPDPDLLRFEHRIWEAGYVCIAGVDEAGVGPLAGPVIAAAVILPARLPLPGIQDSKTLSSRRRSELEPLIKKHALAIGIGEADVEEIKEQNIFQASLRAMQRALFQLNLPPDYVLVDARHIPDIPWPQQKIIHGDALSQSIAAASILAKEHRDRLMCDYDRQYPQYGFRKHKGYPTPAHQRALLEHGPCPIHRTSFRSLDDFTGYCHPLYYQIKSEIHQAGNQKDCHGLATRLAECSSRLSSAENHKLRELLRRAANRFAVKSLLPQP